jgi:hypothetical protein
LREIQPPAHIHVDHPWAAEFTRALAREDLSPLTVRGYARDVALFLDWYTPNKLEKLSAVDLIPTLTAAMTVENIFAGINVERRPSILVRGQNPTNSES